jgi:hypothetical protein
MYDYEDEKEYVREIYWESKGLGKADNFTSTTTPNNKPGAGNQCPKCGRVSSVVMIEMHLPKCVGTGE